MKVKFRNFFFYKILEENYELKHGSIVLAAITSCTNTSNEFGII